MSHVKANSAQLLEVAKSCKFNAPKLSAAADKLVSHLESIGQGFEDFNTLAEMMKKLKKDAILPIEDSFNTCGKCLEIEAEAIEKMTKSIK